MSKGTAKDFDSYSDRFPNDVQQRLREMREAIRKAAPEATETISYRIPAFRLDGILVWYAAHTSHIGFYPGASAIATFAKELSAYESAKGSVRFPFDEPLPLSLVARIVKYRVREQLSKRKTN